MSSSTTIQSERPGCPDCYGTETYLDYTAGDVICTQCGLILDSHYIDDQPEWRSFGGEGDPTDRSRVGDEYQQMFRDGGISTHISNAGNGGHQLQRTSYRLGHGDGRVTHIAKRCAEMVDQLGLGSTVKFRAFEKAQKVEALNLFKCKNSELVTAACLFLACKLEERPRTVKDICSVAEGLTTKTLGKAVLTISKHIKEEREPGSVTQAQDYVRRFCGQLMLKPTAIMAAAEIARTAQERLDIRKNPMSIAATSILLTQLLSGVADGHKLRKQISVVCGVTRSTVADTYALLYPHAAMLVPRWLDSRDVDARLKALPVPRPKPSSSSKGSTLTTLSTTTEQLSSNFAVDRVTANLVR